ncbi:MAG: ABC transporter permease [Vicinamibacteraceae bacterium]
MRVLRDILLIYRRQVRQSLRVPMTLVLGLLQPMLYLLFFGPVFSRVSASFGTEATGLQLFVPGILVQLGMFSSAFVGFGIIAELRLGIIERFRVTPVSRLALLLGRVLRDASLLGLQGCVLLILALALGLRAPFLGLAIALALVILLGIALSSLSYALGLVTRQEFVFAPFLNMVLVPVLLLSGILLPMSMGPPWLRTLSRFNPLSHVVDAIRDAFLGRYATMNVVGGTLAAVALAIVAVTLATRLFLRENA